VRAFGNSVQSFVHVDLFYPDSLSELLKIAHERPFTGYRLLGHREVPVADLKAGRSAPRLRVDWVNDKYPEMADETLKKHSTNGLFACWLVWERLDDFGDDHGPDRFSLLHIRDESVDSYEYLFNLNGHSPSIACSINPGIGYGLNYKDFLDLYIHAITSNKSGIPEYMAVCDRGIDARAWSKFRFPRPVRVIDKDRAGMSKVFVLRTHHPLVGEDFID
jgi:hypothetical protein